MFSRGFCILPTSTNHNLTHPYLLERTICSSGVRSRSSGSWNHRNLTFGPERIRANPHTEFSGHSVTMKHSFDRVS